MRQLLRRIREHHLLFEWRQDWRDVVHLPRRDYNWYTFHPFLWELEWDRAAPGVEMTFMLLGLGFRVRWNFDWSGTELQQSLDDIENGTAETMSWEELEARLGWGDEFGEPDEEAI